VSDFGAAAEHYECPGKPPVVDVSPDQRVEPTETLGAEPDLVWVYFYFESQASLPSTRR
jgi:hypothetical protein